MTASVPAVREPRVAGRGPAGPVVTPELLELVARDAAEAQERRDLTVEVLAALRAAGFRRHLVPREFGGAGGGFADLTEAVAAVGEACASTAWCASVSAYLARMAAFLPDRGAREVWSEGPDAVVVGSLIPGCTAEPVPGGWRVTGRWPYISGADHADWALLCAWTPTADGPDALMVALPRADYRVERTWSPVGMLATGSHTLVTGAVVVPAHRTVRRSDILLGRREGRDGIPLRAVNALSFAVPALGSARGMLAAWRSATARRRSQSPAARAASETVYARAAGELDAAGLLLRRAAGVADTGVVPPELEVRNLRDCALAADMLAGVAERLFRGAGTTAQAAPSPLERHWRDIHAMASHVVLGLDAAAGAYAEVVLGPVVSA